MKVAQASSPAGSSGVPPPDKIHLPLQKRRRSIHSFSRFVRFCEKEIMASQHTTWTREEHILAFNLYCKIPFGQIHMRNPHIIQLARMLKRSIGSVPLKLSNFARLDPALQARGSRGMSHGTKGEIEIWREFGERPEALVFESERMLAARLRKPLLISAGYIPALILLAAVSIERWRRQRRGSPRERVITVEAERINPVLCPANFAGFGL